MMRGEERARGRLMRSEQENESKRRGRGRTQRPSHTALEITNALVRTIKHTGGCEGSQYLILAPKCEV